MTGPDLTGRRVLILGAETEIGRVVVAAVAEAGANVAAVAATADAESAFAVQRLTRRLASGQRRLISQAIDATNEAAVRVMVRQVSKELGGLDAIVLVTTQGATQREATMELARRHGGRELSRSGGGKLIVVWPIPPIKDGRAVPFPVFRMDLRPPETSPEEWRSRQNWTALLLHYEETLLSRAPADVVEAIAGEADSG